MKTAFALVALVLIASLPAMAAEVSTAAQSSTESSVLDHLYLNYFATFHGPVVGDIGSPYTVNNTGGATKNGINLDGELTAAYTFDNRFGVGPVLPFVFTPVMGKGAVLGDAGIKAFDRTTYNAIKGLNIATNLIVQLPTSDYSKAREMDLSLKTTPSVRYSFTGTRFTVGAWTEAKAYLGVVAGKTFKLYGAPYVNYRVLPTLSLNLEYEMEADHFKNSAATLTSYQTDLQPGVVWNITPKVLVNPYLQLFTGSKVSQETMAVGAVLSATVL